MTAARAYATRHFPSGGPHRRHVSAKPRKGGSIVLRDHHGAVVDARTIGDWMGRDPSSVFHAVEDGQRPAAPHRIPWSEAEDAILVTRRAAGISFEAIAEEIGRSVQACGSRMCRHNAAARAAHPQPVLEQVEDCTHALWRATDAWFRREASRRGMPIIETVMTILHGADVVARARAA